MDQPIPTGTGQQLSLDLLVGILQTKHLRLMGFDGGKQAQIDQTVHAYVAAPISTGQVLQFRTDLDAPHSIPSIVGGISSFVEQRRTLILDKLQFIVAVDDLQQLLGVYVPSVDIVVGASVQTPDTDRVVRGAGDEAFLWKGLRWLPLHVIWHCLHAPDASGVIKERVRLAHS